MEGIAVAGIVLVIALIVIFFAVILGAATYILKGAAIYKLSETLGIKNGWMGFIPFAAEYKLGQLGEESALRLGQKKRFATLLLTLWIILNVLSIPNFFIGLIEAFSENGVEFTPFAYDMSLNRMDAIPESFSSLPVIIGEIVAGLFEVAILVLDIVFYVNYWIACHKIYKVTSPDNATLYTVLTILFKLDWLFLFITSFKKDVPARPQQIPFNYAPQYAAPQQPMRFNNGAGSETVVYAEPEAPTQTVTYTPPAYTPPVYTPPVYTPPQESFGSTATITEETATMPEPQAETVVTQVPATETVVIENSEPNGETSEN